MSFATRAAVAAVALLAGLGQGYIGPRPLGRRGLTVAFGRKFENNKVKMAKTAAAYTKKASYIGKKIQVSVRSGGPDPNANRQLAQAIQVSLLEVKEGKTGESL